MSFWTAAWTADLRPTSLGRLSTPGHTDRRQDKDDRCGAALREPQPSPDLNTSHAGQRGPATIPEVARVLPECREAPGPQGHRPERPREQQRLATADQLGCCPVLPATVPSRSGHCPCVAVSAELPGRQRPSRWPAPRPRPWKDALTGVQAWPGCVLRAVLTQPRRARPDTHPWDKLLRSSFQFIGPAARGRPPAAPLRPAAASASGRRGSRAAGSTS